MKIIARNFIDMEHTHWWPTMVDILEHTFPKGACKERGRALVMLAYLEMMLKGVEFVDGEPKKKV